MAAVEAVRCFGHSFFHNCQSGICGIFQRHGKGLFLRSRKRGEDPVGQIKILPRLCAYANLDPGEILTSQLGNNGLQPVMSAGRAVATNSDSSRFQGDVIGKNNNSLRWNLEIGAELQNGAAGKVHISQGLQEKKLHTAVGCLPIQSLKLCSVNFAAQIPGQKVDGTIAAIVLRFLIFLPGISEADDQPGIA